MFMTRCRICAIAITLAALHVNGQEALPVGITRGHFVALQGGALSVRNSNGVDYGCFWDAHTLFTRRQWPIRAADLSGGEYVEVLADRRAGIQNAAQSCYARIFAVIDEEKPATRKRSLVNDAQKENWIPAGNLTFAGLVTQVANRDITIRTRTGLRTLALREDTRYSGDGLRVLTPEPLVNKHVFIRAGHDLYGTLQAYQVMWGRILAAP